MTLLVATLLAQAAFGRPTILKDVGIEQRPGAPLPLDLLFRDELNHPVTLRQFSGKPIVLALVYYKCPSLCDMVLNGVIRSLKGLKFTAGDQFEVVAVSFDPHEDAALASSKKINYVKAYNRDPSGRGLHFLTGTEPAIRQLADAVGFHYKFDPVSRQFAHPGAMMLITPEGKLSRYFYGIDYPARDVKLGLIDASGGKIGSPIDQLQLFCFHYDASTGKYGLLIMNVLRLCGALTVAALLAMFFLQKDPAHA